MGKPQLETLSSHEGYVILLNDYEVASLKDCNQHIIRDFGSLKDGSTYTLGRSTSGSALHQPFYAQGQNHKIGSNYQPKAKRLRALRDTQIIDGATVTLTNVETAFHPRWVD